MRSRLTGCVFMLTAVFLLTDMAAAAPYFRSTGLMNIPTAYVTEQGFFSVGVHTAFQDEKRYESAIRIDFGIFNFAELGMVGLRKEDRDYVTGNLKLLLSRESGSAPGLSIGVDSFGEKIQDDSQGYERSFYGVVSKQFNLPVVHLIGGHLGIGNNRYRGDIRMGKYLHGIFLGLDKEIYLSSLNSRLSLMCEADGKDLNAGLRYSLESGLSVGIAVGELTSRPEDIEYHLGISFSNTPIMQRIEQNSELAKRAVKIANELHSDSEEQ